MIGYNPVKIAWFATIALGSIEVGAFGEDGRVETRFEERLADSEVEFEAMAKERRGRGE